MRPTLTGIDEARKTLAEAQASPERRAEALGMLIHFIGDIHQPLHSTERNKDRGGNTFLITGKLWPKLFRVRFVPK